MYKLVTNSNLSNLIRILFQLLLFFNLACNSTHDKPTNFRKSDYWIQNKKNSNMHPEGRIFYNLIFKFCLSKHFLRAKRSLPL